MLPPDPLLFLRAVREPHYSLFKKLIRAPFPLIPFVQVHHVDFGSAPQLFGATIHCDWWLQTKFSCKLPVKEVADSAIFLHAAQSLSAAARVYVQGSSFDGRSGLGSGLVYFPADELYAVYR